MQKVLWGLILIVFLAGCNKSKNQLTLEHPDFSVNFPFNITMTQVPISSQSKEISTIYSYGESSKKDSPKDSLIISKDSRKGSKNLSLYTQQVNDELNRAGYQINTSTTKQLSHHSQKGETIKSILKEYQIKNDFGDQLYVADYFVILNTDIYRFSYTSDNSKDLKPFISGIKKIQF